MHRFLFCLSLLAWAAQSKAQLKEGSFKLGSLTSHQNYFSKNIPNTYYFSPEIGYMVENFLLIGANLSLYKARGWISTILPDGSLSFTLFDFYGKSFSAYVYGIKPRKINPNSYFYGGVNGNINNGLFSSSFNATVNFQGGMYYFLNSNIAIDAYAGLEALNYISGSSSTLSSSTYLSNLYFGTTLSLFLNTNKVENKAFDGRSLFQKGNAPTYFSCSGRIYRGATSSRGFSSGSSQWIDAHYSKEFFVQNNLGISIGTGVGISYYSFAQPTTTFPTKPAVQSNRFSLSITPSVAIHYYYPFSQRAFLQTGLNLSYSIRKRETTTSSNNYFNSGVQLGLGYFIAPNLVLSPMLNYQGAKSNKYLNSSISFSYRMNNKQWWK